MTDGTRLPAPETIEAMLDHARDSLDLVVPARDPVYHNDEILMEEVTAGFVARKSAP